MYPARCAESSVIIFRVCKRSKPVCFAALAVIALAVTACTPSVSTHVPLPTYAGGLPAAATRAPSPAPPTSTTLSATVNPPVTPSAEPNRQWAEQPFGTDRFAVTFYTDADGRPCLRGIVVSRANDQPLTQCAGSARATLIVIPRVELDSQGSAYSLIAGRVLDTRITAVSLEFADGSNTPAEVQDGGFLVVLPGSHTAIRAVPIDQYGNLVGSTLALP